MFKRGDMVTRGYSSRGDVVQGAFYTVDRQEDDKLYLQGLDGWYEAWKFTLIEPLLMA